MLPDFRTAREVLAQIGVSLDALPPVDRDAVERPGRQGHNQGLAGLYAGGAIHAAVRLLREATEAESGRAAA